MFDELSDVINKDITFYFNGNYYQKIFKSTTSADLFYILLNHQYAVEISVNYMEDIIDFKILKIDEDGKIDESSGYYSFENGKWKRKYLDEVCEKLNIEYDKELLKKVGALNQKFTSDDKNLIDRINMYFEAFRFFFKHYPTYILKFDTI